MNTEEEQDVAIWMASKALYVPNADPDDDLRTISRQFLRSIDQLKQRDETIKELKHTLREILGIADLDPLYLSKVAKKCLDNAEKLIK